MTVSTEKFCNPEIQKIQKLKFHSTNSNKPKHQFEFVPQDTEKSEFVEFVDFGGVVLSVETVMSYDSSLCVCVCVCVSVC